jgi:hypothetical protein
MKLFLLIFVVALLVAIVVLPVSRPASASTKANPDTLRQWEADFMKAAAEHGSQGYLSYCADDAVELPNGGPIIQGKVNIAKGM